MLLGSRNIDCEAWRWFCAISEVPEEKGAAPEFIKVPHQVVAREHDRAQFLVKVVGSPKPTGETLSSTGETRHCPAWNKITVMYKLTCTIDKDIYALSSAYLVFYIHIDTEGSKTLAFFTEVDPWDWKILIVSSRLRLEIHKFKTIRIRNIALFIHWIIASCKWLIK